MYGGIYFLVKSAVESRRLMVAIGKAEQIIKPVVKTIESNAQKVKSAVPTAAGKLDVHYQEAGKFILDNDLKKAQLALMPKIVQLMHKVKIGEIQNIIITAVGTGMIAPIFIKYNPLSKADNDTRTYTAFRQPVSAVLAVVTQAGIVDRFNKYINNRTNSGKYTSVSMNKAGFQDVKYLEAIEKKNNPNISKEQLAKNVEETQLRQLQTMIDSTKTEGTIQYVRNGRTFTVPTAEFKELLTTTTNEKLKHVEKEIKRYQTEKLPYKIERGQFLRANNETVNSTMNEVLAGVEKLSDDKEIEKYLDSKIKNLKSSKADKQLVKMVTDIKQKSNKIEITNKITETLKQAADFAKCATDNEVKLKVEKAVQPRINSLIADKENIEALLKEIDLKYVTTGEGKNAVVTASKTAIKDLEKSFKKVDSEFLYNVVQKQIKNVAANIEGNKQVTGLISSLAILPLTCGMLNYIYPKIMDTLFPDLSKAKHSKEKDKFVKGCNPNPATTPVEVKKADNTQEASK